MFEKIPDTAPTDLQEAADALLAQANQNGGSVRYIKDAGIKGQDDWNLYNNAARWLEQRGKGKLANGSFKHFDFYVA